MGAVAERQNLVKVAGIDGFFARKSGGDVSTTATKVWNGGDLIPGTIAGPAMPDDVTVGRPYQPERDAEIIKRLRTLVGKWQTTITVTPTDENLSPIADNTVYSNALLMKLTEPAADAASGDAQQFELVFSTTIVQ